MADITITDLSTNPPTITERNFTLEEIAQRDKDAAAAAQATAEAAAKAKSDGAATTAAIAHAKSLGFTDAMIAVMYPNLGGNNE